MESWKQWIGHSCKLVYKDGLNHYSTKRGRITEVTTTHLILENNTAILLTDILRIEKEATNNGN